jgi:hypothetical protein
MDPEGRAYVTFARDESNKVVDIIQLLPDGTSRVIAADISSEGKNDLNAGTYVEEDGKPYVVVSSGFGKSRGKKINLEDGSVTDWAPGYNSDFDKKLKGKNKNVKDFSWVAEGIKYRDETYNLVGLYMVGATGWVFLASSDASVGMATAEVSPPSKFDDEGTYGAAFNFKRGGVDSDEPTYVYFSNNGNKAEAGTAENEKGFLTQLKWDDSDGDAEGSFTFSKLGSTEATSSNDGGGCPFVGPPILGSVVVWPPACVLTNPKAKGSTFPLEITNKGDSRATFYVSVTVNGEHQVVKKVNFDGTTKEFGKVRAPVPIEKTEKFTFDIEWGNKWEAEVELDGEKLAFSPSGGVLNEEACDGKRPPDPEFLPTATLLSVICAEDGGVGVVKVTLDTLNPRKKLTPSSWSTASSTARRRRCCRRK